jgi:hypothetical protein
MNNNIIKDIRKNINSQYWIYIISSTDWKYLFNKYNNNKFILSSFNKVDILKNDIIIIYQKNKNNNNGFMAFGIVSNDMKKNDMNIKIFQDKNMNRFYIELNVISMSDNNYKIMDIDKKLQKCKEYIKYKKYTFLHKYIIGNANFVNIPKNVGKNIVEELFKTFKKDNLKKEKNNNFLNIMLDNSNIEKDIEINIDEYMENIEKKIDVVEEIVPDEIIDGINNEHAENIIIGKIPILIIPCKDCINIISIDSFINHYNSCDSCEIINNNNREINKELINRKMYHKNLKNSENFLNIITLYQEVKKYVYCFNEIPEILPIYLISIDNKYCMYNSCYFIVW